VNILIIGSGGREHALARQIGKSPLCDKIFVSPGNAGTAQIAENIALDTDDFEALKSTVLKNNIQMLVIGPEKPLVNGLVDFFKNDKDLKNIQVIGPSKSGATLEGSKQRAKEFMASYDIPTAAYEAFTRESLEAGKKFLEELNPPYVLKADGLAGGKGVLILENLSDAKAELENMLTDQKFGKASETVIIEEFLDGIELSVFAITDGQNYKILPTAKDYKRIGEGDTGLNTGGMGAVSPVPFADQAFMQKIEERVVKPTIKGLQEEKIDYKGFVFFGLINVDEDPYVIEYNVRMGDPEAEVVLPRIKSDLLEVFQKTAAQKLDEIDLKTDSRAAATVMLVSGGYPEHYEKGKEITGLDQVTEAIIFHGGTKTEDQKIKTNGGRVLAITAFGDTIKKALSVAYRQADKIHFDKKYYRKDLGNDLEHID